ncbi:MAG: YkgJ family cysteine cluster protein, partial [Rhodospirillales bacterium]|nr:YkgJ family cysteine cluster protein [Rhodospirillales bacterium]
MKPPEPIIRPPAAGTISARLRLHVMGRQVEATLEVPTRPVKPQAVLPALQALVDAVVASSERALEGKGRAVSCKAGCGACCRQFVPLTAVEAHHLQRVVERMPGPRRARIEARFADAMRRLRAAGLEALALDSGGLSGAARHAASLAYFKLGIACPFLEDESCSIHPVRPLACREYLVTSPAANCASPTGDAIEPVEVPKLSPLMAGFGGADGAVGAVFALTAALEWAAAHPDTAPERAGPQWVER